MSAEAFPWVDVVEEGKPKKHCTRHDKTFAKTSVCPECRKAERAALPAIEKAALPAPPAGCLSTVEIERWFVTLAKASIASADAIIKHANTPTKPAKPAKPAKKKAGKKTTEAAVAPGLDFHDEAAIANHRDRAIKAMRAATELATRREDDAIVDARDERMAARERGASN